MIYLDYAATFPTYSEVAEKIPSILNEYDFNPSSVYPEGVKTRFYLAELREKLAFYLNVAPDTLFFTGSATEAANMVIKGLNYRQRNKVLVWDMEHKAVAAPADRLGYSGVEVVKLHGENGKISFADIEPLLDSSVRLVCLMQVNNETGHLNNVNAIAKEIKAVDPDILVLCDMAQSFCKLPVSLDGIDFAVMSAHKVGGMKGCGLLYAAKSDILMPLIEGGDQERGLRSGTENVAAISVFVDAAMLTARDYKSDWDRLVQIRRALEDFCTAEKYIQNSPVDGVPFIFNFSTLKLPSEVMINHLSAKDIMVSAASACSGKSKSRVLSAMGCSDVVIDTALRVSFSPATQMEDIEALMKEVKFAVDFLAF